MRVRLDPAPVRGRIFRLGATVAVVLGTMIAVAPAARAYSPAEEEAEAARADSVRNIIVARSDSAAVAAPAPRPPFVLPSLAQELRKHVHNKIVHFPIALSLAGFALLIASRRRPGLEPGARALIWTAAIFAVVAYFTGRAQEGEFLHRPKEWVAHVHENWGIGTVLGLVAWGVIASWGTTRPLRAPWGVLVVIAVLVTAYFGGILAHGH